MVIEKDWEAQFDEVFPEWKDASEVETLPLYEPGTAPRRSFIHWDDKEYLPRRDTIKIWVSKDLASTQPVEMELEYWFAYEAGKIITRYHKTPDVRFRLLMIYGKGDTPDPEQIIPMSGRDHTMMKIEDYFRKAFRHAMREAILKKLGATPNEVMGLDKIIQTHTTVTKESDRG